MARTPETLPWQLPPQALLSWRVTADQTDQFQHTNNTEYVRAMERCAWQHSEALGLSFAVYQQMGAGCVVRRHEIDYLAATGLGDELVVGTWVVWNDGRLSMQRGFEIFRLADARPVLRALTLFVSVNLATGRPVRMPEAFVAAYVPTAGSGAPDKPGGAAKLP